MSDPNTTVTQDQSQKTQTPPTQEVLVCPKCGSTQIHVDKRGFDAGSACCGAILIGPLGLLCGADGANKLRRTCLKCNKTW